MGKRARICASLAVLWGLTGSGCAWSNLKQQNHRLRDSNERLIAENNQLEEELAALQRQLAMGAPPEPVPAATTRDTESGKASIAHDLLLDDGDVQVSQTSQGVRFTIQDRVFFAPGQVQLTSRGKSILNKVAGIIRGQYQGQQVRVDGHTDDTPVRKVRKLFPSNWELSTARACTVVRYLVDKGVAPTNIYPAGFSYHRPIARDTNRRSRGQNRRVEITILNAGV